MIDRNIIKGLNLARTSLSWEMIDGIESIYNQLFKHVPISIKTNGKSPSTIESCIFYIIVNKDYMDKSGKVVFTIPCISIKQTGILFGVSKTSINRNHKLIHNMIEDSNIYIPEIKYVYR